MRIKSLTLQNIRSYVEETIFFPDGSLLLAGDIGAGKSTLLLAIEFALFGTKRGELDASSLLRNGSHAGKIELSFAISEKEIKICRILKRTPTAIKQEAGSLTINGQRQDLTPLELRARIMDILGYPKETQSLAKDLLFRYTVFTPQEQMRQILYDDREARLNTIRRVFQMDKYKKICENAHFLSKELRIRRRILEETLLFLPQLEKQLQATKEQLEEKKGIMEQLSFLFSQSAEITLLLKKDLVILEAKQKEQQQLLTAQAGLRSKETMLFEQKKQIEKKYQEIQHKMSDFQQKEIHLPQKPSTKNTVEILQELDTKQKELQSHLQQKALLFQQIKQLQQQQEQQVQDLAQFQNISTELQSYEQQLIFFTKELEQKETIEKSLLVLEEQFPALLQKIASSEIIEKNAFETRKNFEELAICTLCQQEVSHDHKQKIVTAQTKLLEKTIMEKNTLLSQKETLEKHILDHKTSLKQTLISERKKAVLISVIDATKQKKQQQQQKEQSLSLLAAQVELALKQQEEIASFPLAVKEKEVADLRSLFERCQQWESLFEQKKQQALFLLDKQNQATQCTKEIQTIEEQLLSLGQQLAAYTEQLTAFASLEQNLQVLKKKIDIHQEEQKAQEIALKTVEKEIENLLEQKSLHLKEYTEKKNVQKKCAAIGAYTQWLDDYFVPMVSLMEKQVLLQVHHSFQDLFSKWFTMLMEDSGINGRIGEDFSPLIEQNGYDVELFDLSGGEKTAVSLAYRLALNKVINDFMTTIYTKDLLILDEPTEGFSSEQLEKVRDVLCELQSKQVIIVSHESKVESFVDSVLRIEKQGYASRVVH